MFRRIPPYTHRRAISNSRALQDEYLRIPFNLSGAIVIATANDAGRLPSFIQDRLVTFEIAAPSGDDLLTITRLIVSRRIGSWPNLVLDVEGYKSRRTTALRSLAKRMADQVRRTHQPVVLEPMPANERRIVHLALRDDPDVYTESTGEDEARKVWLAIALHTTPGVPEFLDPEIALVTAGVETDVVGIGLDDLSAEDVAAVTTAHRRPDFKKRILAAFNDGMKHRPQSTYGTMNADVLAHFDPEFVPVDFTDLILNNPWPE